MKLIILLSIVLLVAISSRKVKTGTSALPAKTLSFSDYSTQLRALYKTAKDEVKTEAEKVNKTKISLKPQDLKANELYPTQGEIALSKSLKYLVYGGNFDNGSATANVAALKTKCTSPKEHEGFISGPLVVAKITDKTGYAILDGHHRWAQLFLASPDCKVYCLLADGEFATVDDALKSGLYLQVLQTDAKKTELESEVGDHNNNDLNNQLNLIGESYSDDATKASGKLKAALEYYYDTDNLSDKVKADRQSDKDALVGKTPDLAARIKQTIDAVGENAFDMYKRGEVYAKSANISRSVMPQTKAIVDSKPITSLPNFNQTTASKKKTKKLK